MLEFWAGVVCGVVAVVMVGILAGVGDDEDWKL
jgi:hypothetical protein